jgi:mono/diheme cytochrome c family protein
MRKLLKWFGVIGGGLVLVAVLLVIVLFLVGSRKVNRTYDVAIAAVSIPADAASIARGKHYVEAVGVCQVCHGQNLAGPVIDDCKDVPCIGFSDESIFGKIAPANLTSGIGGIGGSFTDDDYIRAIRHGIGMDNQALTIMPAEEYNRISDDDLGAIIAYLKTLPPVDNEVGESGLGPLGRTLASFVGGLIPASLIDHEAQRPQSPAIGLTAEYGEYLSNICAVCHGEGLSGSRVPGNDRVKAPDITMSGDIGSWTKSQFLDAIRSGNTPRDNLLDPRFMPWNRFTQMTNNELDAIWLYLESLPGK